MGDPLNQLPPPSLPQPEPSAPEPAVTSEVEPGVTSESEPASTPGEQLGDTSVGSASETDPTAQIALVHESSEPPSADEIEPGSADPTQQIPLIQEATLPPTVGEYGAPSYSAPAYSGSAASYAAPEYSTPAPPAGEYEVTPSAVATAPTKKKSNGWVPWVLALVLAGTTVAFAVLWNGKSGDLDDAKKANASVASDIADADEQISDLEAAQADLETAKSSLESDKADLQAQLDEATSSEASASDDLAAATAQIDELTTQVDDLGSQVSDLTAESSDLQTQLETAQDDLETALADAEVGPALTSVPFFSITVGQAVAEAAAATLTDDQAQCIGAFIIDEVGLAQTVESASSDDVIQQQVAPAANSCGVDPALFAVG